MAAKAYRNVGTRNTPVTDPIPGTVPNSGGGHSFPVDDWTRLRRFLILGTEGGSYYASEAKLTKDNAQVVLRCIKEDGARVVDEIESISVAGRNAKQAPVLLALAACAGADDVAVRTKALAVLPRVARTGTMLFQFIGFVEQFRGWGRGLRNGVANWYLAPERDRDVAFQVAKYQMREGWSHKDVLALAKPQFWHKDIPESRDAVLRWAAGLESEVKDPFLATVDEVRSLSAASKADTKRAIALIGEYSLPWEVLPSEFLTKPEVWTALLPTMGIGALVRNLGRLTANGTIKPMSDTARLIVKRLTDPEQIGRSRLHPLNVLTAAVTYQAGKGFKGGLTWAPNQDILAALDETFDFAFGNVQSANKRTLIGLDVSGSMTSALAGTFLSCRVASTAMCLVTMASEPEVAVMAFSGGFIPVKFTKRTSLVDAVKMTHNMPFDMTNCAAPMQWAIKNEVNVDTFVIYTDSETNSSTHPKLALEQYRQRSGIPAKLIVVGMVANRFSIADPGDAGMLDVVGFDSAAPALIGDFSAGRV